MLAACGGRTVSTANPTVDASSPEAEAPLGVCENKIEYSDNAKDETSRIARFGYDAAGHLVRYVESYKGKRVTDITCTYERGLVRTKDEHFTFLKPSDRHMTWTFDDTNRFVLLEVDSDASYQFRRSYDALGRIDAEASWTDGKLSRASQWSYPDLDSVRIDATTDVRTSELFVFAKQRWLTKMEMRREGILQATETYTYSDVDRGEVATRALWVTGTSDTSEKFTWAEHRLVRADYNEGPYSITRNDFTYDDRGRLIQKRWFYPQGEWLTTITYAGDDVVHVERRDVPTHALIERWAFTRTCKGSLDVRIAPMIDWQREMETLPIRVDRDAFFHDVDAW